MLTINVPINCIDTWQQVDAMHNFRRVRDSFLLLIISVLVSACMVGPDFKSPTAPQAKRYTVNKLPSRTVSIPKAKQAGAAQHYQLQADVAKTWWQLFHSPLINRLVLLGMNNNPSITIAKATLKQAQDSLAAQVGSTMLPAFNATATGTRQKPTNQPLNMFDLGIYNLFNAAFNVSYTFDFFGANRRQIEASRAQVDYQSYELAAAYLALTSNIVTTVINAAALQAQVEATEAIIADMKKQLKIVNSQFQLGSVARSSVLTQQTLLAQMQATLPALQQNLTQNLHALAILIGLPPSEAQFNKIRLSDLHLPTHLPVTLPSVLVKQRPDILAAEAQLHVALAQVGVATANLFPQITLTGSYGWTNPVPSNLFHGASNVWNIAGGLTQPLFQGGALFAQRRAAIAGAEAAAAQYKQTVLAAFKQVADTLRALQHDAEALRAQQDAVTAAQTALTLTKQQFKLGGTSFLELLTTQQQYQQAQLNYLQTLATRYNDTAALFAALGGGWWSNRKLITSAAFVYVKDVS